MRKVKRLLTKGDVAKIGGVTPLTVHNWMVRGWIQPDAVTVKGIKLFDPRRVEHYLAQRRKRGLR